MTTNDPANGPSDDGHPLIPNWEEVKRKSLASHGADRADPALRDYASYLEAVPRLAFEDADFVLSDGPASERRQFLLLERDRIEYQPEIDVIAARGVVGAASTGGLARDRLCGLLNSVGAIQGAHAAITGAEADLVPPDFGGPGEPEELEKRALVCVGPKGRVASASGELKGRRRAGERLSAPAQFALAWTTVRHTWVATSLTVLLGSVGMAGYVAKGLVAEIVNPPGVVDSYMVPLKVKVDPAIFARKNLYLAVQAVAHPTNYYILAGRIARSDISVTGAIDHFAYLGEENGPVLGDYRVMLIAVSPDDVKFDGSELYLTVDAWDKLSPEVLDTKVIKRVK